MARSVVIRGGRIASSGGAQQGRSLSPVGASVDSKSAGRKRTARGEASRTRILNSAIRLMWRDGYDGVSVEAILIEAGALKGSFYYYFTSKVDLLLACLDHLWSVQRHHLRATISSAKTARAKLTAHLAWLCEAQLDAHRKYGYVPGLFHMSVGASSAYVDARLAEKFTHLSEEHQVMLRETLEDIVREESLTASSDFLAEIIGSYVSGAILRARVSNDITPIAKMPSHTMKLLSYFEPR